MTFSPDPLKKHPAAKEVVVALEKKGINPEGYVVYAYAAIQPWAQAAEKAHSADGAKVVDALNSTEFDRALGKFRFDAKGDPEPSTLCLLSLGQVRATVRLSSWAGF